jgi:hypothetical protein
MLPNSYTAVHRYDGAIIQRQRCDDPQACALRQRDLAIVRDVWRYHFLTTNQVRELWWRGKSIQAARRRLVKLLRAGYLERFRPYSPRGSYEWTYFLSAAGHRLLRDLGVADPASRFKPRDVFDYGRAIHDIQLNAWVLAYRRAATRIRESAEAEEREFYEHRAPPDWLEAHEGAGTSSSFDRAVEAAASLVDLYHRVGYGYRLLGAASAGTPVGRGSEHRNRCRDFLALVQPTAPATGEDAPSWC